MPPEVEATAYFVVSEALANVGKYSNTSAESNVEFVLDWSRASCGLSGSEKRVGPNRGITIRSVPPRGAPAADELGEARGAGLPVQVDASNAKAAKTL
jgi:hypothetical protein